MNELRGVKLADVVGATGGEITEEELAEVAAKFNSHMPHPVKLSDYCPARLVRVYVKDGALYGDLEDVPAPVVDYLKKLKQSDALLCVTLHLGDETK